MSITEIASLILPIASAVAIIAPVIGNRRVVVKRLDALERTMQLLLLHDEHLPYSERLNAGKRYTDMGGNGASAAYYKQLEEKYKARVERHMGGDI